VELSVPSHRPRSKFDRSPHERRSQRLDLAGHWPRTVGPTLNPAKLRYCNRRKANVSSHQGHTRHSKDAVVTSNRPALSGCNFPSRGRLRTILTIKSVKNAISSSAFGYSSSRCQLHGHESWFRDSLTLMNNLQRGQRRGTKIQFQAPRLGQTPDKFPTKSILTPRRLSTLKDHDSQ
jgi:hypothetical protein